MTIHTNQYSFQLNNCRYLQPKDGLLRTFQNDPVQAGKDGIVSGTMVQRLLPKPTSDRLKINPDMRTTVMQDGYTLGDLKELSQVCGSKGKYNGEELARVYFKPPASVVEVENEDGSTTNHVLLQPNTTMFIETVTPQMAEREINPKARTAQLSLSMPVPSNDNGINLTLLQQRFIAKLVGCTDMSDEQIISFIVSWHSVLASLNESECQKLDEQIVNLDDLSSFASEQHGHLIQCLNEAKESATQRLQLQTQVAKPEVKPQETREQVQEKLNALLKRVPYLQYDMEVGAVTPLTVMAKNIAEACLAAGMGDTKIIEILSEGDNPKLLNRISNRWGSTVRAKLSKEGLMDTEGKPLTAEKLEEHIESCLAEEREALRQERKKQEANNKGDHHHHTREGRDQNRRYM